MYNEYDNVKSLYKFVDSVCRRCRQMRYDSKVLNSVSVVVVVVVVVVNAIRS